MRANPPRGPSAAVSVAGGLLLSLVIGGSVVLLLFSLPRTTAPYSLAARAVGTFDRVTVLASVEQFPGQPSLFVRCRQLRNGSDYVTLGKKRRLIVSSSAQAFTVHAGSFAQQAEIRLAGCRDLIGNSLANRIVNGKLDRVRRERFQRRAVYGYTLSTVHGTTELLVDRATLVPLALVYRSRHLRATARLILRPPASGPLTATDPLRGAAGDHS